MSESDRTWDPQSGGRTVWPLSAPVLAPTLSVTVLNYNYGSYLPRCLDSILSQTFQDFELIVIDDCSTDDSLEVVKPYLRDPRVRLVPHARNVGYSGSLIEGTEVHSRGDLVTVISADDVVRRPDAFERQIELLSAHPEAAFCFSGYDTFASETGQVLQKHRSYVGDRVISGPVFLREYLTRQRVQVLHSGTMLRKSAYDRAGGYRRDLRITLDLAMWPVLSLQGDVVYCDDTLYAYRAHDAQMSSSFKKQHANFVEVMKSVEGACDEAVRHGVPIGTLRADAVRYSLFAVAVDDAFSGRSALALFRCLSAVLFRPWFALTSRGLWITLARLVLGERGYTRLRGPFKALLAIDEPHASIESPTTPHDPRRSSTETLRDLRVVLCANSVEMGGVEEHVRQLGAGLVERHALVTAIVPEYPVVDPLVRAAESVGVAVERLTLGYDMFSPAGLRRLDRMVRLLRDLRPDILHLHLVGFSGGRWVLLAARLAGVPNVVCTIHVAPGARQPWRARLDRAIQSRTVSGYIAVSRASRERLIRYLGLSPRQVVAIPNAVELRRFTEPAGPARQAIRAECGIPPDAPVVGVLARLSEQKGLTYLISAVPAILAAHPETHVVLVGDGPLREDLVSQARSLGVEQRIHFVGYRANTVDYLRAMDLFVLPSLYEGMPLSILEAMGAGLPVVATAVDGTPEAVADGETGYLVPPADPEALASAVNRVLGDRALASAMGRNGRARAEAEFSETALIDRLGPVYRAVLGRRRRGRGRWASPEAVD